MARASRELLDLFRRRKAPIRRRLREFTAIGERGSDRDLFRELAFCILTPQSSAHRCDAAIRQLEATGLLWTGSAGLIAAALRRRVRFHNHKARYLVAARNLLMGPGSVPMRSRLSMDAAALREWLVETIPGFGYKEASHFLRNIGRGEDLAILDRHILRNLVQHRVLRSLPKSLSRATYLAVEARLRAYAKRLGVTPAELDLLLWSRETGEVFK
jgi:N-glycosylase/DNA lyase